jgi:MFS family permease
MSAEAIDTKLAVTTQEGHRWWLFTACVLVSLTNEMSTAVTNLSLGPLRHDLGASSAVMQMAVTLGKLMLGAFMLAGGVAGDVYGRRRVLALGALGMVGASLLAAVAQTGGMLLVARALDGLASAAIGPMALALVASAFSQAEQTRVIGLFLGLSGLGAALGPLGAALGFCNPWPLASEPCLPSSGGNGGPGIHYWMSRFFAIAPSLWPSRPDYWPHWSSAAPFYRCSISCKLCKR